MRTGKAGLVSRMCLSTSNPSTRGRVKSRTATSYSNWLTMNCASSPSCAMSTAYCSASSPFCTKLATGLSSSAMRTRIFSPFPRAKCRSALPALQGEAKLGSRAGLDSLMKASPSLITSYFGRKGAKDEEISKKVFARVVYLGDRRQQPLPAGSHASTSRLKGLGNQGRFNPMGKLSLGPETPC